MVQLDKASESLQVNVGIKDGGRQVGRRLWVLDFSLASQIDGLAYSLLGIRIERDFFAQCEDDSLCKHYGATKFVPTSAFFSIYFSVYNNDNISSTLARARQDQAMGFFVVPFLPEESWFRDQIVGDKRCTIRLLFCLPDKAIICRDSRLPIFFNAMSVVLLLDFGFLGSFKKKRRKERMFTLDIVPQLNIHPLTIGTIPTLLTRPSTLAAESAPTAEDDTLPCQGRSAPPPYHEQPGQLASLWNISLVRDVSSSYPHTEVAQIAREATCAGLDPFRGKHLKTVIHKSNVGVTRELSAKFRSKMVEERDAGRTDGPYDAPPFAWYRLCPYFSVPKNKHDPTCTLIRPISHFSAGRTGSVNALCYSPLLIGFHARPMHIRDKIAACGRGARMFATDVPHAFRWLPLLKSVRHLFVYKIITEAFGTEFWVDGFNPFGWTPSEWAWQCVLAILMWQLLLVGLHDALSYVDNFFLICSSDDSTFEARSAKLEGALRSFGLDLHEHQHGTRMKGLGWIWDSALLIMECPPDKFIILRDLVSLWARKTSLSVAEWDKACGMLNWLSAGFTLGKAGLAHLIHDRTVATARLKRAGASPQTFLHPKSKESTVTFSLWNMILPEWDRTCPIVGGFSPTASWEIVGKVDACTGKAGEDDAGAGGWMVDGSSAHEQSTMNGWSHRFSADEIATSFVAERESTGVLEAMGARLWLTRYAKACAGRRVLLCIDNSATVFALERVYSKNKRMMVEVEQIAKVLCTHHIVLRVRHVHGDRCNVVADHLSHLRHRQACLAARRIYGLDLAIDLSPL